MHYINTLKQELSTVKAYDYNLLDDKYVVDMHRCHIAAKFSVFVDEDQSKLPTLYWLPMLHKRPINLRLIAHSSSYITTELSVLLPSCLPVIKNMFLYIVRQTMRGVVKSISSINIQTRFFIN